MIFISAQIFRLSKVLATASILAAVTACQSMDPNFKSTSFPIRPDDPSPKVSCDLDGVETFESLISIPFQVTEALLKSFDQQHFVTFVRIAERDAAWNSDDGIDFRLANQRFIAAMQHNNRWIIWYEQGASFVGPMTMFIAYDVSPSLQPTQVESGNMGYPDRFTGWCETSARVLRANH